MEEAKEEEEEAVRRGWVLGNSIFPESCNWWGHGRNDLPYRLHLG